MRGIAIGALSIVLSAQLFGQSKPKPCQGKMGVEKRTLFDYRQNVDLRFYDPVPGVGRVPITGSTQDAGMQQKAREEAFRSAFSLVSRLGLSYEKSMASYLQGYHELRTLNDSSILRQQIKIYRERETRDFNECVYKYEVELAVPKFPTLGFGLDELIRKVLEDRVKKPTNSQGSIELNVAALIEELLKNPEFRARLDRLAKDENFQSDLQYKDDDTQIFFGLLSGQVVEIPGYPKGQYRVNSLVGSVIARSVIPTVQFYLARYKTVSVACQGFTDRLAIHAGGISYDGFADMRAANGQPLRFQAPVASTNLSTRRLRTNAELSAARAFEGISALASGLGSQLGHPGLALSYVGRGEAAAGQRDHPASRKIVFLISYKDRQR